MLPSEATVYTYDIRDRVSKVSWPNAAVTYSYDGDLPAGGRMSRNVQSYAGLSVAVLAAVGLLALAAQESGSGSGGQVPAVIGLLLLVLALLLSEAPEVTNRRG